MSIRLLDFSNPKVPIFGADTKAEVPETGAETVVEGWDNAIPPFSRILTNDKYLGALGTDDKWKW